MRGSRRRSDRPERLRRFDLESPLAIELRRIMIRLGRTLDLERQRTLMVTSAQRGEGKSLFSLHFSLVLAHHLQKRILLVDGDVRRPVQHAVFGVPRSPGLSEMLAGENPPAAEQLLPTMVPNLRFLPAGGWRDLPSRLFAGGRFRQVLEGLKPEADIILVDAPPVVPVSDPLHYAEAVDGVIYMVMAGRTPRDIVKRGVEILQGSGARILGVVANNLSEVMPYYYDRKYYGYEPGKKRRRRS
jgi:succinoglycan biosynthesis transport protein ExoP